MKRNLAAILKGTASPWRGWHGWTWTAVGVNIYIYILCHMCCTFPFLIFQDRCNAHFELPPVLSARDKHLNIS